MRYAEITGWGKAMPPAVLSNADLERMVDTSDEWITTRSGIKERRISHIEVSELAAVASHHALEAADRDAADMDMLILATSTPETMMPPTSAWIQSRLGNTRMGAMDINVNCAGFVYALVVASDLIKAGSVDRVLLVGAEKMSYIVDYTDRSTCVLFGDGAGAVVLEATTEPLGVLASELGMDGSLAPNLCVPEFGTVGAPAIPDPKRSGIQMNGSEVFRSAVTMMGSSSIAAVEGAGWELGDVDLLIPHQANQRIIDATARRLGLDDSKVFSNIHAYGNTSAATIPVALTEALESDRVRPGSHLVFAAFGGGLSWGAAAVRWGSRAEPVRVSSMEVPSTSQSVWEILRPNIEFFGGKTS